MRSPTLRQQALDLGEVDAEPLGRFRARLSGDDAGTYLTALALMPRLLEVEGDTPPLCTFSLTFTALSTGLRRGELPGYGGGTSRFLEGRLTVRKTFVRGRMTSAKSDASQRTIELGPQAVEILTAHWQASAFRGDDELVFCHPTKGTPADASKLSGFMRKALTEAEIRTPRR